MATTPVIPAAAPASTAPAAATASTSSPVSTSTPSTGGESHQHVPDGQQGAGALDQGALSDAMLSAFEAKKPAVQTTQAADTDAGTSTGNKVETPAVEAPAVEGQTQTPVQQEEDGYNFDEDSFVGARDMATKLEGHQLPDELKNEVLANARIAEQLAPYRELFGSPEEAKVIAQAAQEFSAVQATFQSITPENVKEGTSSLLNTMLQMSALRDENGEPRRRADGTYITDGTTTRFLNELFDRKFQNSIVKKIEDSGDEAAKAALDLVMERAGLRASTADQGQVDPTIAAERAQLDADKKQHREQQEAARAEGVKNYTDGLNGDLNTLSQGEFTKLLAPSTGLDPLTKTAVLTKLSKAVTAAIKADSAYQLEKRALQAQPMSAARRQAEVALAKKWMAAKLVKVAKPILSEAGITVGKKAALTAEAQAARELAARGDVSGGAAATHKSGPEANPAQQRTQVTEALKAKLGRNPSDQEILTEMMMNIPGVKGRAA